MLRAPGQGRSCNSRRVSPLWREVSSMKAKLLGLWISAVSILTACAASPAESQIYGVLHGYLYSNGTYTTLDAPGASQSDPNDINNIGQIIGNTYYPNGAIADGYLFTNGMYTTIDEPGSISTQAYDINDLGQIIGNYFSSPGVMHGFSYTGGAYTSIDAPDATSTVASGINSSGEIVGGYSYNGFEYGFTYDNGIYVTLSVPGAADTYAASINSSGEVVGTFNNSYSFIYNNGVYTPLQVPGSDYTNPGYINDAGDIVGDYEVGPEALGFLYVNGVYTTIDVPGSKETYAGEINDAGQIVGSYYDETGKGFGFVYSNGAYTTLNVPPPVFPGSTLVTAASAINDFGQIVGYYSLVIPEPSVWAMLLLGFGWLGVYSYWQLGGRQQASSALQARRSTPGVESASQTCRIELKSQFCPGGFHTDSQPRLLVGEEIRRPRPPRGYGRDTTRAQAG